MRWCALIDAGQSFDNFVGPPLRAYISRAMLLLLCAVVNPLMRNPKSIAKTTTRASGEYPNGKCERGWGNGGPSWTIFSSHPRACTSHFVLDLDEAALAIRQMPVITWCCWRTRGPVNWFDNDLMSRRHSAISIQQHPFAAS